MGGIAGRFNFNASQPIDRALLDAMTATVVHRGPAGGGCHVAGGIGLGERRLAPENATARDMPASNGAGTIRVACDGEIYNGAQLVSELEAHGHRFHSRSAGE